MSVIVKSGKDAHQNWIYRIADYEIRPCYNALNRNFRMRRDGWTAVSLTNGRRITLMDWSEVREFAKECDG
jgi:hypothetical protein